MVEVSKRLNPNEDLKALSKYDGMWRRLGLTPNQTMGIKRMVIEMRRQDEWSYMQKLPLVFLGLFINVIHGNGYMSKNKTRIALEEICELFGEMDMALLDTDDVLGYCEREAEITIELEHEELVKSDKPIFKVSGMVTHQKRAKKIMDELEAELMEAIGADAEDAEAWAQMRMLSKVKERFNKEGIT